MSDAGTRAEALRLAKAWIGTPYRHQASAKGAGCDCLGLVRGVWRELYGDEPMRAPPYTPDWAERRGEEALLAAAERWLEPASPEAMAPGDVILFRARTGAPAKHCAILSTPDAILHAYWGRAVCETALSPWWRRRIAGVFSFPSRTN